MASHSESDTSLDPENRDAQSSRWLKVGIVAGVSVLVGGLATAWWYRKTLKTLRQTSESTTNPHFGISADEPADEA
jgi:hypothetical protein